MRSGVTVSLAGPVMPQSTLLNRGRRRWPCVFTAGAYATLSASGSTLMVCRSREDTAGLRATSDLVEAEGRGGPKARRGS